MNDPKKDPRPAAGAAAEAAPEHPELREAIRIWRVHGRTIVSALVLLVAAAVYLQWRGAQRQREAAEGNAALAAAQLPEQLEEVVRVYGRTSAGPAALLALAAYRFHAGTFDVALERYDEFLRRYPRHGMAPAAELGRAHALEALGRTEEALVGFAAFAASQPDHPLAPQAVFGRARCLASAGKFDEARAAYEDFIAANPGGAWTGSAEFALADLDRARRAAAPAAAP